MIALSSYIAYLLGKRLGRSPSGITQMPPPGENDRPQWHTSSVSFEVLSIVCWQDRPTDGPWGTRRNSRTSWIPASSRGLVSFTEPLSAILVVHSPAHAF